MIKRHFAAHHICVRLQSFGPDQAIGQRRGLTQVANIIVAESNTSQDAIGLLGHLGTLCCSRSLAGVQDVQDRPLPKHRETVLSC